MSRPKRASHPLRRSGRSVRRAPGTTVAALLVLECPECVGAQEFEQPPCGDGHDPCPELVCVLCGTALVLGLPDAVTVATEVPLARTA